MIQQQDAQFGAPMTSIYSPVMLYTTHALDAAIQTINALHKIAPFDFGISLGDVCNSTQLNVSPMDPTRPRDGSFAPTIEYGEVPGVNYCASYYAELYKQLGLSMTSVLQTFIP